MNSIMMILKLTILGCCIIHCLAHSLPKDDGWTLKIVHTNDMHARFVETSANSGECLPEDSIGGKCYGGFARLATLVRQAKNSTVPALFLNAGDTYQGTIWYGIHKWKVVTRFLNLLKPDAISLGNHEFDDYLTGLIPFINKAKFPIVTSNLNLTNEPKLAATKLQKSIVLDVAGHKVGIIGFLTSETAAISHTERVIFLDEVSSIRKEVKKLQSAGVNILIALGHSGFEIEKKIAAEVDGLDLVIGGHTNTFLYNGDKPDLEQPQGLYPTVVIQESGRKVYVVQAYAYTKYLGNLTINFDKKGEIKNIEGNPILVNASIEQAQDILKELKKWQATLDKFETIVGSTKVSLDGDTRHCRTGECNLGNLIVDAMIDYNMRQYNSEDGWTDAAVAINHSGAIRTSIARSLKHNITMENILAVLPFQHEVEKMYMTSDLLVQILEHSVHQYDITNTSNGRGEFLHFSGLQVVYDLSQPSGSRVHSVLIRCADCTIPVFEPLEKNRVYKILINHYIHQGGCGYTMLTQKKSDKMGITTDQVLVDYLSRHSPVHPDIEWRIKFMHG